MTSAIVHKLGVENRDETVDFFRCTTERWALDGGFKR